MKKSLLVVVCVLMVLALGAGCAAPADGPQESASAQKDASQISIGVVLPTKDEILWLQDEAYFKKLAEEKGCSVEVLFSQASSAIEKTNVETLVSKGIDVLVICPFDAAAAAAAVNVAKEAGITVICYNRLCMDTDAVDYYVTFDSVKIGEVQAQYLVDKAEGKGNPLYLYAGAVTDNNAFLFFEGSWKVLQPKIADGTFVIANSDVAEKYKDMSLTVDDNRDELAEILGQITTNWEYNTAKAKAESNLAGAGADMKGTCFVLAPNDGVAGPIADAFMLDAEVEKYYITGQDAEIGAIQYILDGKQSMTVFPDPRLLVQDVMDIAFTAAEGGTPATDTTYNNRMIDVPSIQEDVTVVTAENVKEVLVDSGYYDASKFEGLE